jgi:hypothetical protein
VSNSAGLTPARRAEHEARDKRLAEALRENLRRRKAQARAKESEAAPPDQATDVVKPRG